MLGLNETQSSLVALVYKFCDDKHLPLLDLKDFKKVLEYITGEAKPNVTAEYGLVPTTSTSLILRKLIELDQQGAEEFFGEPSFEMSDLLRVVDGFGVISILRLTDMQNRPKLFSSFMLQMLAELYATLPEVGDLEKPKLVLFLDEAHLIFDDAEKSLLTEIETVIKLIRSKGVGIFFCTQLPTDVPDAVLGQLGMKVQHALRAFTAKDRKSINLVAQNYPETSFYKTEQLLTDLGIGEALVTVLDERGAPTPLVATDSARRAPVWVPFCLTNCRISQIAPRSRRNTTPPSTGRAPMKFLAGKSQLPLRPRRKGGERDAKNLRARRQCRAQPGVGRRPRSSRGRCRTSGRRSLRPASAASRDAKECSRRNIRKQRRSKRHPQCGGQRDRNADPLAPRSDGRARTASLGGTFYSKACARNSSSETNSSADECVASRSTGGATPRSSACFQRETQMHQRSPGSNPAKPHSGCGVTRSLPISTE